MSEFDAFKDTESAAVLPVQRVGLRLLLGDLFHAETARVMRGLRMVRDAEILVAAASRGFRHCLKRVDSVGAVRMRMKDPGNVGIRHKLRQRSRQGARNLIASLAQLGRDGLHAERLVDRLFRRGSHDLSLPRRRPFSSEHHVSLGGKRAKARKMRVRPVARRSVMP